MDMYAFAVGQDQAIREYLAKHYGDIPRFRGVRFMKVEQLAEGAPSTQKSLFNSHCGKDVFYIHTRCGDCEIGYDDADSNYVACGAADWEKSLGDLFIEHITDEFDPTYCDHYLKAVPGEDYDAIIAMFKGETSDDAS